MVQPLVNFLIDLIIGTDGFVDFMKENWIGNLNSVEPNLNPGLIKIITEACKRNTKSNCISVK